MPLQRGEVQGYNFNRMAVEFTMVNQGKVVSCSISTAAMDDLEGRRDVKSDQRLDQFMRLREIIEERASRKFFEEQAQADRPVVPYGLASQRIRPQNGSQIRSRKHAAGNKLPAI
jgi:Protein of unknown function (DUF1488)